MTIKIDQAELDRAIREYDENGATVLRGVVPPEWVARLADSIDGVLEAENAGREMSREGEGRFFGGMYNTLTDPGLRAFVLESGLGEVAGRLMQSREVRFFYDQLLVKEPGTAKVTPWHQDLPYWPTKGEDVISLWVPVDPATPETGVVTYVKGSHRWNMFAPMHDWSDREDLDGDVLGDEVDDAGRPLARNAVNGATIADIRDHPEKYEFLEYSVEPGDVLIHHAQTIHGAPGNLSSTTRRRALATRWFGDNVTWDDSRPHFMRIFRKMAEGFPYPQLETGDPIVDPLFPLVWKAEETEAA